MEMIYNITMDKCVSEWMCHWHDEILSTVGSTLGDSKSSEMRLVFFVTQSLTGLFVIYV